MGDKKNGENGSALLDLNKISRGTAFKGDIASDGDFRIDGRFEGNITTSGRIVVGPEGRVDGVVNCANAEVEGVLNGTVNATDVLSVKKEGKITGDISATRLAVELGAVFDVRSCHMNKQEV